MNIIELLVSFAIIAAVVGLVARSLRISDWLAIPVVLILCAGLWFFLRRQGRGHRSPERDRHDDGAAS